MRFQQAILRVNGKTYPLQPNRANTFDEIYVDFQAEAPASGLGTRYSVFLHPKENVRIQQIELQFHMPLPPQAMCFCNGYQSWSESRLMPVADSISRLHAFARKRLGWYGDDHIHGIPRGKGRMHSWTYTYFTQGDDQQQSVFCGSLNEKTGFTLFLYDQASGMLQVRKDLDDLDLRHSFPALDFWVAEGKVDTLFDAYFQLAEIPPPSAPKAWGWTSWYRHFTRISAQTLLQDLEGFDAVRKENAAHLPAAVPYFQIDDGWQSATGDWLSVKNTFPGGMRNMALKIREKGMSPGLWLAPFVATAQSDLVRKHPEWLLKNKQGQAIRAGWNPHWGGWFYALDFYNDGVREYLSGVFHTILDKWGFDLLKLDFLFAVAIAPPAGKTRGGVMWEAMDFLRHLMGRRHMLACGVPLGAAFGLADYCRIGGDVHLSWQHGLLRLLRFRERVDTLSSLHSTLGRRQLNGRAFHNDPDVFILRSEGQHLLPEQQYTLLIINALLGGIMFTSDAVQAYSDVQQAEWEEALGWQGSRILRVEACAPEVWKIEFEQAGEGWVAYCNLDKKEKNVWLANGTTLEMRPYETMVLKS